MPENNSNIQTSFTNPIQNNATLVAIISYAAGIAAGKLTFFDLATWNYIFMGIGGAIFAGIQFVLNRKTAMVATVASMPEVNKVELAKGAPGVETLAANTPENVTVK